MEKTVRSTRETHQRDPPERRRLPSNRLGTSENSDISDAPVASECTSER